MGKKKVFDPFKAVVDHGVLTAGTIGSIGIAGKINQTMPSSTGSKIMGGMDSLKIIPVVHGAGIAMGSLGMLGEVEKKARKKR